MLELPDAQGGEQKAFRAGEGADGGGLAHDGIGGVFAGAASARLGSAGTASFLSAREMADVIHNFWKAACGPAGDMRGVE